MTQVDLELVAREMRARGLHSSWDELLTFSRDLVGNLVDAYQELLKSLGKSDKVSSINRGDDAQKVVIDKLAAALVLLTGKAHVAKWELEALDGNILSTAKVEGSGFEESRL